MSVITPKILGLLMLSLVLAMVLVVSTFLLGIYLFPLIWLAVSWPAHLARAYGSGLILDRVTMLLLGKVTQGRAHWAELILILGVWWPICFIATYHASKRLNLFSTIRSNGPVE